MKARLLHRPSSRKLLVAATTAVAMPALLLSTTGPASADPSGAPTYRPLVGVGSDTTEEVVNGLSNVVVDGSGNKVIASYNATGGAFVTKDPATKPGCDYAAYSGSNGAGIRANGSGAGRSRLLEALDPANPRFGCLDFARSSSLTLTATTPQLTYVPFGVDALTYAVRGDSAINRKLSQATLKLIYQCDPTTTANFLPLLPQSGSGTRSSWLSYLGLTEATKGACVKDTYVDPGTGATANVQEHNGFALVDRKNLVPYSASQYSAQSIGVTGVADNRGTAVLGGIAGIPSQASNGGSANARTMYNVVPTARVGDTANHALLNSTFVGSTSAVCAATSTIALYGFGLSPACGATNLVTAAP